MPSVLITGASRGLGLEFARQYHQDGWRVFACCRRPDQAEDLAALARASAGRITLHPLDVTDPTQVAALAAGLKGEAIDLLLNNAGVYADRGGFGRVDYEAWRRTLEINTLAPLRVAEALVEHVARSERKLIANVTSLMGSIGDNGSGGSYAYRSSKAALNMVTVSMSIDLRPRGITCVVLHPGWVATDMGGAGAPLQAPESVSGMRRVLAGAGPAESGKFFDYEGDLLPW